MTSTAPIPALSIRQPFSWLIVNGYKDVENREWSTNYRGPVLIHAGKQPYSWALEMVNHELVVTRDFIRWMKERGLNNSLEALLAASLTDFHKAGGIVGIAEITDCVTEYESPWFTGKYGFVLANARSLPFMPCRG